MRLAADTAIHALRLLKHAQDNAHGMSGPAKLAMYLPLASNPIFSEGSRRLEEIAGEDAWVDEGDASATTVALTSSAQDDDFMALMDNEYMKKIENQCHVNVEGLFTNAISQGAILASGDANAAQKAMSDPEYIQKMLSVFGDFDGQRTCAAEDLQSLMGSYSGFLTCTGMDALIGKIAVSGFDFDKLERDVMEKCEVYSSALTSVFSATEESSSPEPTQEQMLNCVGSFFEENNPIGEFIRDFYEHSNKYCSCFHELGEKVPECTMEEEGMKVSTSLIKSATCVWGVGCEAYKDFCGTATDILEQCLPGVDEEYDCTEVMMNCAGRGAPFPALPHFVSHHLPDTCQDVAQDSTIEKYESFQEKCAGKKDFMALAELDDDVAVEEFSDEPEVEEVLSKEDVDEIKSEEAHIVEEEEDLKEEQEEIKEEIEFAEQLKSEAVPEEEEKEEDTSSASLPMAGIAIVACAVVISFVVIKKKFFPPKPKTNDFTPVSDGGFEYEQDADAGNFIA